jgi:hypothetical protein
MFPSIGASDEKCKESIPSKGEAFSYPHFETFANATRHRISFEKAMSPP